MYIVTIYIHVPRSLKLKKKYDTGPCEPSIIFRMLKEARYEGTK